MAYNITQKVPIVIGPDAIMAAGNKMKDELNCSNVLLVSDPNVAATGAVKKVQDILQKVGLNCFVFDACEKDAPSHCCDAVAAEGKKVNADIFVAIGGGSTMDTTKGAAVIMGNGGKMIDWLMQHPFRKAGDDPVKAFSEPRKYTDSFPVVCIPTTAGTGSEAGSWAVIEDEELGIKDCIMYEAKFAVIDPIMTVTCPKSVTVACAFDALAHAAESITSNNGKNLNYDYLLATGATQLVFDYLEKAVETPDDLVAREKIATASTIAGFCLNYATAHIGHSIADGLLYKYNFPHGYACMLALPSAIKISAPYAEEEVRLLIKAQGGVLTGKETPEELGEIVMKNYVDLAKRCGVEGPKARGISREEFTSDELVEKGFSDKLAVAACRRPNITKADMKALLEEIYDNFS